MKIEFFIPKYEELPTELLVKADDVIVNYNRVKDEFAYDFSMDINVEENKAKNIVEEICNKFCRQSYDHGARWCVINTTKIKSEPRCGYKVYRVSFRIRDSY